MLPELFLNNLLPWSLQVFALAALGAALPLLFRVRHPGTHLVYCHVVLVACLLLPLVQPWQHPLITLAIPQPASAQTQPAILETLHSIDPVAPPASTIQSAGPTTPVENSSRTTFQLPFRWSTSGIVLSVLISGIILRLGWLLVGLWRIRQYRIGATPLYPIPEAVQAAASVTHANALFCISPDVAGPVTLGWLAPVVLLPESFVDMEEEAQCAIACHELLHVRRHDWLVTLIEESAGALLWFNPAIWMLLSQTRLTREQLVDAEVVRLTSSRDSYIDALLKIARGRQVLDLAPAPLFLRRRHLTRRMHALLKEVTMSKLRLLSSYGSMTALLGIVVWLSLASFPLVGNPQYRQQAQNTTTAVNPPQAELPVQIVKRAMHPIEQSQPTVIAQADRPVGLPTLNTTPRSSEHVTAPIDVHEPVTIPAKLAETPEERTAAIALLERAKQNSKLHIIGTPSFSLRVSFQASGDAMFTGQGEATEDWANGQHWRWTAKLGSYSQAQFSGGSGYLDESPTPVTPMRVHDLRSSIFWAVRPTPSSAEVRTANVSWNGKMTTCVLFRAPRSFEGFAPAASSGRGWNDEEYCFDNANSMLVSYSMVSGSYVVYGYSKNRLFHGRMEPDQITIYRGGAQVLDAQLDFSDLGDINPIPNPVAGYPALALILPARAPIAANSTAQGGTPGNAIIHASIGPVGLVIESEIVSATDSSVGQAALKWIRSGAFPHVRFDARKGGAAQQDMYFDVHIEQ